MFQCPCSCSKQKVASFLQISDRHRLGKMRDTKLEVDQRVFSQFRNIMQLKAPKLIPSKSKLRFAIRIKSKANSLLHEAEMVK